MRFTTLHLAGLHLVGILTSPYAAAQTLEFTESASDAGLAHFFSPALGYPGTHDQMVGGLTVTDFNNDGWPDIYALGGGDQPDRLFLNLGPDGPGAFSEADPSDSPGGWNLPDLHRGSALASGDVNKDGLIDLYITSYGPVRDSPSNASHMLLLNRGGRFENVASVSNTHTLGLAIDGTTPTLGDIDCDGDLDLFVCAWAQLSNANRLFINTGNNPEGVPIFIDATDEMGVDLSALRGFTARMVDMTGDRLPDLLLNGDFRTSRLLINEGLGADGHPRFTDATHDARITEDTNAMGMDIADVDNDADLDWFITNIYSSFTGHNSAGYLNQGLDQDPGNGSGSDSRIPVFIDTSDASGVGNAGWGWGTVFADFDHDSDLDLAVTGGWFQYPPTPSRLYRNDGPIGGVPGNAPVFTDCASQAGFDFTGLGRTLVTLDADRDGDLDVLLSAKDVPLRYFRNDGPVTPTATNPGCNWLILSLDTSGHPCLAPNGRHAEIRLDLRGDSGTRVTQHRTLDFGPTYLGSSEPLAHFGLGAHNEASEIRITLPDGSVTELQNVQANQHLNIEIHHPADANRDGRLDLADVPVFVASFSGSEESADLNMDGLLDLSDLVRFIHALSGSACD